MLMMRLMIMRGQHNNTRHRCYRHCQALRGTKQSNPRHFHRLLILMGCFVSCNDASLLAIMQMRKSSEVRNEAAVKKQLLDTKQK